MLASEISQERRIEQLSEAKRSLQMKYLVTLFCCLCSLECSAQILLLLLFSLFTGLVYVLLTFEHGVLNLTLGFMLMLRTEA